MVTVEDYMVEDTIRINYDYNKSDRSLPKKGREDSPHIATSKRPFFEPPKMFKP